MRYLILLGLMAFTYSVSGQNKELIIEKQIKRIKSYEQDIDQGEKELLLEKEESFNTKGKLTEFKEFDEKGRVKKWERYKYNKSENLLEEQILNYKGNIKKRIEHIYVNGVKIEKLYYDDKNRLYKKKKYEFEYRK